MNGELCLCAEHGTVDLVLPVCSVFVLTWPGKTAGAESADSFCRCQFKAPVCNLTITEYKILFFGGECDIVTPPVAAVSLVTHSII